MPRRCASISASWPRPKLPRKRTSAEGGGKKPAPGLKCRAAAPAARLRLRRKPLLPARRRDSCSCRSASRCAPLQRLRLQPSPRQHRLPPAEFVPQPSRLRRACTARRRHGSGCAPAIPLGCETPGAAPAPSAPRPGRLPATDGACGGVRSARRSASCGCSTRRAAACRRLRRPAQRFPVRPGAPSGPGQGRPGAPQGLRPAGAPQQYRPVRAARRPGGAPGQRPGGGPPSRFASRPGSGAVLAVATRRLRLAGSVPR